MIREEGTELMVDYVASAQLPLAIRVIAANYLFRARGIEVDDHLSTLIPVFNQDSDARIRMCLATAIAKSGDRDALRTLRNRLAAEQDYRVKCNILRSLAYFPYTEVKEIAFGHIYDKNIHVAKTAATYLAEHGEPRDAKRYRSVSRGKLPWEVKTTLYLTAERYMSRAYRITKGNMKNELVDWFNRSNNPYERAAILTALAGDATNLSAITELGFDQDHPAIRTAAVSAVGDIALGDDLAAAYPGQLSTIRRQIASILADAIESGDVAMIAVAAGILGDESMHEAALRHLDLMKRSLESIELPSGIETYNALDQAIAAIEGSDFTPRQVEYNHPVDWPAVAALGDSVYANIVTDEGTIEVELFTDKTPGTVMNFVELSRSAFYDGKNFHRVVPNFVIQDGCPRGDGYGSLDYTIRSELVPVYYDKGGYLGMASAGNHTESMQWFITHSPTPHLDGNYTLFGRVVSGMDVVHGVQVGDEIRGVEVVTGSSGIQ
jgi:cyclophilin family peptidyl-prolyl cis-trans isomerase